MYSNFHAPHNLHSYVFMHHVIAVVYERNYYLKKEEISSCNDVLALQEISLATFRIELGLHSMCMSRLHALYFMLHTSYSMCMYLR